MNTFLSFLIVIGGLSLYFLPLIVAACRGGRANTGAIAVINTLTGWTIIGWIAALAMACSRGRDPAKHAYPHDYER